MIELLLFLYCLLASGAVGILLTSPCCCNCAILVDPFTRTGAVGDNWTVVSGSWDCFNSWGIFGNNQLRCTSPGIIIATAMHPEDLSTHVVEATLAALSGTQQIRLLLCYTDADNYLACVAPNRLIDVTGGVETVLADGTPYFVGAAGTLRVGYDGTKLKAVYTYPDPSPFGLGRTKVSVVQATVSKTGKQVGVQITGLTGNDSIDNFKWYRHRDAGRPTCPIAYVPCTACQIVAASGDELARWEGPLLMKFVIAGVANGTCGECTKLNGTYILYAGQTTGYVVPDTGEPCRAWTGPAGGHMLCGGEFGSGLMIKEDHASMIIYTDSYGFKYTRFEDPALPATCMTWLDHDLSTVTHFGGSETDCDWSAATNKLTTL